MRNKTGWDTARLEEDTPGQAWDPLRLDEAEKEALQESYERSQGVNPDDAAAAMRFSPNSPYTPEAIVESPELMKKAKNPPPDLKKVRKEAPTLAEWLANPQKFVVAQDDIGALIKVERGIQKAQKWLRKRTAIEDAVFGAMGVDTDSRLYHLAMFPLRMDLGERLDKSLRSGVYSAAGGMASGAKWLIGGARRSRALDLLSRELHNAANFTAPPDPDLLDKAAQAGGSMATFFIPGLGIAKGASWAASVTPRLARWLGASSMTILESMAEAGGVYEETLQGGGSEKLANERATKTFWMNVPLLAITNKLGIFGETGGDLWRLGISGLLEGGQEIGQEKISSGVMGREMTLRDYLEVGGLGMVFGGGAGVAARRALPGASADDQPQTTPRAKAAAQAVLNEAEKGLKDSALADRSPEDLKEFMNDLGAAYNVPEKVYIEPENLTTLFQVGGSFADSVKTDEQQQQVEDPVDAAEILEDLGITEETYYQALETGAPIGIEFGQLGHVIKKPTWKKIKPHLSFDPASDLVEAEKGIQQAFRENRGLTIEQEERIRKDIKDSGRPDQDADIAIGLLNARARVWAGTTGRDPGQYLNEQWKLRFEKGDDRLIEELIAESNKKHPQLKKTKRLFSVKGWGPEFTQFSGKPHEAIRHLMDVQDGYVPAAISRPDIGDIDFVWGRGGPNGYGLAHILDERGIQKGLGILLRLPDLITKGALVHRPKYPGRAYIANPDTEIIIRLDWDKKKRNWVLTTYFKYNYGSPASTGRLTNSRTVGDGQHLPPSHEGSNKSLNETTDDVNGPVELQGTINFKNIRDVIISFFQAADITTAPHEIFHLFQADLETLGKPGYGQDPDVGRDYEIACKFVGAKVGETWTRKQHEKFAEEGVKYLINGQAPTAELRPLFTRMKDWFLDVYDSVVHGTAKIEVSPEMRGVFDRLLATKEELADAQEALELVSAFGDQPVRPQDVPPDDWKEYEKAAGNASSAAEEAAQKKRIKELDDQRRQWKKEGRAEANADLRIERVTDIVKRGGIRRGSLFEYDAETVTQLSKLRPGLITKKGKLSLDELAEEYGMSSDELFEALMETPTKAQFAEDWAARREEEWEHYYSAEDSVLVDERHDLMEMEITLLGKTALGNKKYKPRPWRGIKSEIARQVGKDKLFDAKMIPEPVALKAAFIKAQRAARQAYRAGDKAGALREKERARWNLIAYQERVRARQERQKGRDYLKKIIRQKPAGLKAGGVAWDYHQQIRQLLARYDLVPPTLLPDPETPSLRSFVERLEKEEFETVAIPDHLLDGGNRRLGDLSLDEFRELIEAVKSLAHLGRQAQKLITQEKETELEQAQDDCVRSISENNKLTPIKSFEQETEKRNWRKKLSDDLKAFRAELISPETIIRMLDGKDFGTLYKYIFKPIKAAEDQELTMGARVMNAVSRAFEALPKASRNNMQQKTKVSGIESMLLTREQRIMAALNAGNEGNLTALCSGYGWSESQVQSILDTLTKEEWGFVQTVWEEINSLFDASNETHIKVSGVPLKKVEGIPVQTPFGVIEGAYFPLKFDGRLSSRAEEFEARSQERNLFIHNYQRPTPARGHTISRVGGKMPPRLDFSVISQHISEACHNTTHAPAIRDLQKLLKPNGPVAEAISRALGEEAYNQFPSWLQHIARPQGEPLKSLDKIAGYLRRNTTTVMLGLKLSVASKQFLSFTQTWDEIGFKWAMKGLSAYFRAPWRAKKFVEELSPSMAQRQNQWDRELGEVMSRFELTPRNLKRRADEAFFYMIGIVDAWATYPTWLGAYRKEMAASGDEKKAIEYADMIARRTQPTARPKDVPEVMRGREAKRLFTMFYTFFSRFHQQMTVRHKDYAAGRTTATDMTKTYALLVLLPAILGFIINERRLPEGKEAVGSIFSYYFARFPIVRDALSPWFSGYEPEISPVGEALQASYRIQKAITADEIDARRVASALTEVAGYLFGLPAKQINITAGGFADMLTGEKEGLEALISLGFREKKEK